MHRSFRWIAIGVLVLTGWLLARCGDVIVNDLNPADFTEPTPTPTLSAGT